MIFLKKFSFLFFIRIFLAIIFALTGYVLGASSIPPNSPVPLPPIFRITIGVIFALFGLILPEITTFIFKTGLARLIRYIAQEMVLQLGRTVTRPLRRGGKKEVKTVFENPLILDTSVLIDGRLIEVLETGFLSGTLIVVPSVINELHALADSSDQLKRQKGRRGLEILNDLKKVKEVKLKFLSADPQGQGVDQKLIDLAKKIKGKIITTDFNLSKVAQSMDITTLNINGLASSLRPVLLPGETLTIRIEHLGKEKHQGVGYLPDGTMVVVEDGGSFLGREIEVLVSKMLQTVAGRMVFAKPWNLTP